MRRSRLVWLILLSLCSGSLWAAFPGLRYLGEIGHLGTPSDPRTSVRFGNVQVVSTHDGALFHGRDDDGKSWQAVLPIKGGMAFTTVWRADFDHNSRPDLLIAAHSATSGRCLDEVTLSFLLFNDRGQAVPWVIQTRTPDTSRFPPVPAIFTDLNHNGRAEFIVTDCAYSDPPRAGEDRRISGIYEARDASWSLVTPVRLDPYSALVRQSYRLRPEFDHLLTTNPSAWQDRGNRPDPRGSNPVQLTGMLTRFEDCRGAVHIPPRCRWQVASRLEGPLRRTGARPNTTI